MIQCNAYLMSGSKTANTTKLEKESMHDHQCIKLQHAMTCVSVLIDNNSALFFSQEETQARQESSYFRCIVQNSLHHIGGLSSSPLTQNIIDRMLPMIQMLITSDVFLLNIKHILNQHTPKVYDISPRDFTVLMRYTDSDCPFGN